MFDVSSAVIPEDGNTLEEGAQDGDTLSTPSAHQSLAAASSSGTLPPMAWEHLSSLPSLGIPCFAAIGSDEPRRQC